MGPYLLVAGEVVEDEAVDDGRLAHRLVAQQHDLAFHRRVVLHRLNVILNQRTQSPASNTQAKGKRVRAARKAQLGTSDRNGSQQLKGIAGCDK